ncbi:MAG: flavin monoamine oxidase family protein [Anaerolineales bacterium]
MLRSRSTGHMRSQFQAHIEADGRGVPVDEVLDEYKERKETLKLYGEEKISRREFIRRMGVAGISAATLLALGSCKSAKISPQVAPPPPATDERVVIIGAGMAGLNCALTLKGKGIIANIYEADHRLGGRIATHMPGPPPESGGDHHELGFARPTEHGASFISSEHRTIRKLAQAYGLPLAIVNGGALLEGEDMYVIDGQFYTPEEAGADWAIAWEGFRQDLRKAPWLPTYDTYTQRGYELDRINVREWFDPAHPHSNPILANNFGPDSRFAKLCYSSTIAEYGGNVEDMPALHLLYTLAWNPKSSLNPLPGTDEYYTIAGGLSQLVYAMAADIPDQIHRDNELRAITGDFMGPYTLEFSGGPNVVADRLVLTIPFNILRNLDIDQRILDGMRPEKRLALETLPMGTNGKVHIELAHRTWGPGYEREINGAMRTLNGSIYTDPDSVQLVWDDTAYYEEGPVVLLGFLGGDKGANIGVRGGAFGAANATEVSEFLNAVEFVFPGTLDAYNGTAMASNWSLNEWSGGAYVSYGLGGYTGYVGAIGLSEGNIFFAGEHCSTEYQGYMEGAAESAEAAALEIWRSV